MKPNTETVADGKPHVSGSSSFVCQECKCEVPAVRIEEALAKYWYDTEYNYIDKSDHKKAEESRARFRKWIDDNLETVSKQ